MHLMMLCERPAEQVVAGPSRLVAPAAGNSPDVADVAEPLVTVGRGYAVSGMVLASGQVWMLVYGDGHRVGLVPASCFAWQRWQVPSMWRFVLLDSTDRPQSADSPESAGSSLLVECGVAVEALWGYRELVDDPGHLRSLLSGCEDTFGVFSRRTSQR